MSEYEKARKWMIEVATEYGLEYEVLKTFEKYMETPDADPWHEAHMALYEWDI